MSIDTGMVYKHAHRPGVKQKMQDTKAEILNMVHSFGSVEDTLKAFTEYPMTDRDLDAYFGQVLDVNVDLATTDGDQDEKVDRATSNKLAAVEVMHGLHDNGKGATGNTRGTLYGAYNAAIEFADWRMGARSKDRARYQLFGAGAKLKERAIDEAGVLLASDVGL